MPPPPPPRAVEPRLEPAPPPWNPQPVQAWPPPETAPAPHADVDFGRPIVVRGDDPFASPPGGGPFAPPVAPRALEPDADAPLPPPPIDLRRVGQPEPPGPAEPPPPADRPPWRFTRQDDRIVVAPADAPVRGPIRSVEDRLFATQRGPVWPPEEAASAGLDAAATPPGQVPDTASQPQAAPPVPPAPAAPGRDFATLTLAGIYESQGYLHKALAIYDALQRQHPDDPTVAAKLAALQRRLAGMAPPPAPAGPAAPPPAPRREPAPQATTPAPAAPGPPAAEESVAWRLLDRSTLGDPQDTAARLRRATQEVRTRGAAGRHDVQAAPFAPTVPQASPASPVPPPPPAEPGRGHDDYERFLQYLRSLKP
jgi:hypothetical protein